MKKRFLAGIAVLMAVVLGAGCSSHSAYWRSYELTGQEEAIGYPDDYHWVEGIADMGGEAGELTLCYLTLAESGEAQFYCSLARRQMQGNAVIYYEDPEGGLTQLYDMSGGTSGGNDSSCILPEGTSRLLVRADGGEYEVGVGISGLAEENILYLGDTLPKEGNVSELEKLPALSAELAAS